ncbi:non sense mediated decay [Hyphodiscus hymeniophilus]|uniref:Non sense mediated decay n=1 Tax=Hyphodiscus hymeniophilus TaxID=353542 RepID=A0A9P6VJK9_9HELO|nr:non sense mediated decay [Hyphodiscus hymeniophilus]
MALLNPTFIFGVVVLLYLSSFILFAILRILTGISIQRIGYFSLRRLAYTPKDGIKIEIRGLGLNLHRPTFAQPTWVSVVLTELAITVDLKAADKAGDTEDEANRSSVEGADGPNCEFEPKRKKPTSGSTSFTPQRSKSWERLTTIKDRIKRMHRKINWLRMVDVVATNSTVTVVDVGQIQFGSLTMAVDTRRKMVDRARMFSHVKTAKKDQRPAEWMITIRSVLFTPEGKDSLEVLDHATLNVHGLLYKELDGLRDAAIALKLGRVHIPYDDINTCINRYKGCRKLYRRPSDVQEISVTDLIEELDRPGSREEKLVQTVSDSKEFVSSILRGIKEVQFAVSYVGFAKRVDSVQPHGTPIYVNASMKEVGVDLHRLDQKSPAHRMYFSSKDVAHQALVAALSIAIGVDDGHGKSDRLIYVPMATTTVRTTLPSKTVELVEDNSADERNANILFANVVVTSPSVDLDPNHLPLCLALLQPKPKARSGSTRQHVLISRLLPKANVKFSMHEPVVRVALPPVEPEALEDDFDLIISSISSISLDIESSHSAVGELHYSLGSTLRLQSHDLYYQTSSGCRYNLLETESLELKVQLSANPKVYVVATGNLQTFSIHMVRPEISDGVRQIVRQLRINVEPEKKAHAKTSRDGNFIRTMPPWLLHFQLQGSDFSAEVAGVDDDISDDTRGVALQLESWTAEYRAQRAETAPERQTSRRRTGSRSLTPDPEVFLKAPSPRKKQHQHPTDGRRLAVHVRGLEGFVVESSEKWEPEPFVGIPRFETALSTSSDNQGPVFHVNTSVKSILVQYSLYRHYACGIVTTVLRKAFVRTKADTDEAEKARAAMNMFGDADHLSPVMSPDELYTRDAPEYLSSLKEIITVDFRSTLLQIKASMPSDPPMMIQIYDLECGRHRWSPPFLHAKLGRLYAEAPKMKRVWARIVSIKTLRVDVRENKRKLGTGELLEEKMIDVNTEAIRMAVPHQLILHKVFDNCINTLKAVQQLHHRFATGTNEYILDKRPEGPKRVPKVSIRSKALLFEVEDGPFEWKLGCIYRSGLVEQAQRIARDAAFDVKAKKIEEEETRKGSSRHRTRSAHPRGRSKHQEPSGQRSKSAGSDSHDGHGTKHGYGRRMRYDPEGTCGMTGIAKIPIGEARERLKQYNAQSWKKRIDMVFSHAKSGMRDLRGIFWGPDQLPEDMEEIENILEVPQRPGLMATLVSDLHVTIDKPSFSLTELPDFLHQVGKGMPHDMKYSLLIPMHVQIDMGEARVTLRDYPLPLLHVPAIKPDQSPRLPAWSLKTDFVIAEEFRGAESTRHVKVDIVPPKSSQPGTSNEGGFAIDVKRTVSPVKSYSDIKVDINTGFPTRITWGASYQPAIQDMMMIIETFTKTQVDPSDRTGFWDKIRLSFHSRVSVAWKGDGDVHLMLKGTRDPYVVTGNGAGFLMCWRNEVRWRLCRDPDPRKFMMVDSGEYILAIPDYSHQARGGERHKGKDDDGSSVSSSESFKRGATFKKVVMKLSGNVQWMAGLMFERNLNKSGERSFDFKPHYEVVLKEPHFTKAPPGQVYDAFRGFRSHHIHMSIAVKAPVNREWSVSNSTSSSSYNTVHLTPRFFTHFFAWWSMFGGTMSLPIRQGKLWPGIEKSSKKFGRHLATIKYNLLLAPLFLSHIYKHKDVEDYSEDVVSATGIKMRLDSFMLDVHQRREEFHTQDRGRKTQGKTTGMKMHQAQLDLISADIRAVSASIAGTTPEDLRKASAPTLVSQHDNIPTDLSHFEIPDNDFSWIDMDDFVELDWILPSEANPETKIMPLAFAPRFTYFRQTDHGDSIAGDPDRTSKFGNEPTHFCIMSKDDDPRRVQCQLIQSRLDQLAEQMGSHSQSLEDAESKYINDDRNTALKADCDQLNKHSNVLRDKKLFLESMMHRMAMRLHTDNLRAVPDGDADVDPDGETPSPKEYHKDTEGIETNPAAEFISDFNNRFVIHNMQLKWNNSLRNIILRYIHQVSQRRGFVYYLSRRAVKFILDIVEEQHKAKTAKPNTHPTNTGATSNRPTSANGEDAASEDVEDRIKEILADGKKFVNADDPLAPQEPTALRVSTDNLDSNIAREFTPQNSYHLRLIAPQIQLQSEKNRKAVVLVTAKGMELKVVEVMDKDRIYDDVSGLVQRRFSVEMDSTQFFVTQQRWFSSQLLSLYSGSRYGSPSGSAWPPWVPMEVMFDFHVDPFGFKRVVQKTSASLRYDKYNTLRLKYNDDINNSESIHPSSPNNVENRMDYLWVEFPQVRAICNSSQYYAMYIIVLDLLMYSEPLEKTRSERLEKIMLASDFSDLRGAPEMVIRLQERIRQLEEIKTQFQIHSKYLDTKGWEDRLLLDKDLTSCEDELFFMMKAITTSQRKYDGSQSSGLLRWNISSNQIVWHLIRDNNEPLMEFQLQKAEYDRTDNSDGSHINLMQIGKIVGLNLLPDAIYPEMFAPYSDAERGTFNEGGNQQMLRVYWYMLEAIAGIPVMDHFEVNLFPMKIQLEREVGKRLFEYMFPGSDDEKPGVPKNKSPFMVKGMQPVEDEDEEDDTTINNTNFLALGDADKHDSASSTRAGSLELRLKPTMTSEFRPNISGAQKNKAASVHSNGDGHHFRLFQSNGKISGSSRNLASLKTASKKPSIESMQSSMTPRPGIVRSSTGMSGNDASSTNTAKRFAIHKNGSKSKKEKPKPSDDLTKMISRASNYMTLAYVKIPSVVLCLSYKGKGERNIEDVHDFVFRLPMIEYRNKTWSNLDLALALKKDVIRALISHTGAIIGNKFSKHRPNTAQQSRLRELASSSTLLAPASNENSYDNSDASSTFGTSPTDTRRSERERSPRRSFASSSGTGLARSISASSSVYSLPSPGRSHTFPASLTMTPASTDTRAESIAEIYRTGSKSIQNGHEDHESKGGFMANTLNRLKKKDREPSLSGQNEDSEDLGKRKSKTLLGKKILGSLA